LTLDQSIKEVRKKFFQKGRNEPPFPTGKEEHFSEHTLNPYRAIEKHKVKSLKEKSINDAEHPSLHSHTESLEDFEEKE